LSKQLNYSNLWSELGNCLDSNPDAIELARIRSIQDNPWFTADHIDYALQAIRTQYLQKEKLDEWLSNYLFVTTDHTPKRVGVICAGNIPMVGFHDIMCVITSGHVAVVKLSHKDQFLIPALIAELIKIQPEVAAQIEFVNRLENYEAIIATGSNNSQRYFKSYFGHVPHLIRHNRTSVGVIHPSDTSETLKGISSEIFMHFGLGCRSISKIFIPYDFDLDQLFVSTLEFSHYGIHTKYNNNFIYHTALFQMNKVDYLTNDLLILLETPEWHSPLSIIYYERYVKVTEIVERILPHEDDIQVIYSGRPISGLKTTTPGTGQKPQLGDYADRVDTMEWLLSI
jgi:hypothetical protein